MNIHEFEFEWKKKNLEEYEEEARWEEDRTPWWMILIGCFDFKDFYFFYLIFHLFNLKKGLYDF